MSVMNLIRLIWKTLHVYEYPNWQAEGVKSNNNHAKTNIIKNVDSSKSGIRNRYFFFRCSLRIG